MIGVHQLQTKVHPRAIHQCNDAWDSYSSKFPRLSIERLDRRDSVTSFWFSVFVAIPQTLVCVLATKTGNQNYG